MAWAAAKYPARRRALSAKARSAAHSVANGSYVVVAAAFAARSAGADGDDDAAQSAAAVVDFVTSLAGYGVAESDASFAESGRSAAELAGLPLWPSGPPNRAFDYWRTLKAALLAANEGWEVWTDWYEARLAGDAGHSRNEALEIARAMIPDEIWKQGPAVVNAEIKRFIAEHAGPKVAVFPTSEVPNALPGARMEFAAGNFGAPEEVPADTVMQRPPNLVLNQVAGPPPQSQHDASLPPVGPKGSPDLLTVTVSGNPSASTTPEAASLTLSTTPPDIEAIIPPQISGGSHFKLDESGRIDLVPVPPANTDVRQRELYDELGHKARELSGLGHNQLGDVSTTIEIFAEALPEEIEAVSVTRLWSRGNTLRRRLGAHEIAVGSAEPSDPARLTPLVAGRLRDLVETFNVFIAGEPEGSVLEQALLGPQERAAKRAIVVAAEPIVEALRASPDIANQSAAQELTEQIEAAQEALSATGVDSDQAVALAGNSSSNAVITLLRQGFAWLGRGAASDIKSGAYHYIGAAIVVGSIHVAPHAASFMVDHADALRAFVDTAFNNPALRASH